jgi:hypothetical protein
MLNERCSRPLGAHELLLGSTEEVDQGEEVRAGMHLEPLPGYALSASVDL